MSTRPFALAAIVLLAPAACGHASSSTPSSASTTAVFDTAADLASPDHFFDMPYPSDARVTATGAPDLTGMPNPIQSAVLEGLRAIAMDRRGFPQMPVVYFRFDAPVAPQSIDAVIKADPSAPLLLMDLDANGALVPLVAQTPDSDKYLPDGILSLSPRQGWVLAPGHKHAAIVMKKLGDAQGHPLGSPAAFAALQRDTTSALGKAYAPLWGALAARAIAPADVATATVFTTGDVVADTAALSTRVLGAYKADIANVHVDAAGASRDRYCELQAQITYPQFQVGDPPYDTGGLFQIGPDGMPIKQKDMTVPVTLSMPKAPMPAGGYPLVVFFHGTGGVSTAIADRGTWHFETDASKCPDGELDSYAGKTGCNTAGTGPAYVVAEHGIGMAASALPVNPQRWPAGAKLDLPEWFNINNVAATRDIFRQGVLESRLFIDALTRLAVDPSAVSACTGMSLPAGESAFHYATDPLLAQGQSMGAMYVNMMSAVEPKIRATVATGAGGFWSYFITQTTIIPDLQPKLGLLLGIHTAYTFMHPSMAMAQTALEPVDPMTYMPRIAKSPLPGHPARPVFQPVGKGDSYFPMVVQDAAALAYGHNQAGQPVWSTMQDALALAGLEGVLPYSVTQNEASVGGDRTTGVVVQYEGDGIYDPHAIYSQLDAVKYQYACFFASYLATKHATVPAPAPLGTPCPM